jgi:hypothetical protein
MLTNRKLQIFSWLIVAGLLLGLTGLVSAAPGDIERVSISSDGIQGNDYSINPSLSSDGRYVAFLSEATTLVPDDNNSAADVFVHDRSNGTTTRVSVDSGGNEANGDSYVPEISGNGRYVVFTSAASNLVANDTNGVNDVFVHDRQDGTTRRVSVHSNGDEGNSYSSRPSISGDGQYIAFDSQASNLVDGDTNGLTDVFLHSNGQTQLVSASVDGNGAGGGGFAPSVSENGGHIAFVSGATDLIQTDPNGDIVDIFVYAVGSGDIDRVDFDDNDVGGLLGYSANPSISGDGSHIAFWASYIPSGEINGRHDVFVHARGTSGATRISESTSGIAGNNWSRYPEISADDRYVVFTSFADNLVEDDNNGYVDVFIHDLSTGSTERVSVNSNGVGGNSPSQDAAINTDGSFVAFHSQANNFVNGDTNGAVDIFVSQWGSVANQPPAITGLTPSTYDPVSIYDQPVSLAVGFDDPDSGDSHTLAIDWGDGTIDTVAGATSPATLTHAYSAVGVYSAGVTVTDGAGESDSATYDAFVVFDPDGGSVVGNGRITSQAGWCYDSALCGNLAGQVGQFSFRSDYQRGATVPTGRTTFIFRMAGFDFESTAYDWLIVNQGGTNAQFRGAGTVNDMATTPDGYAYQFMIWAGDGTGMNGADTFRIKIWYEENGQEMLVYDIGAAETFDVGQIRVQAK